MAMDCFIRVVGILALLSICYIDCNALGVYSCFSYVKVDNHLHPFSTFVSLTMQTMIMLEMQLEVCLQSIVFYLSEATIDRSVVE